jgi:hypothetical protein
MGRGAPAAPFTPPLLAMVRRWKAFNLAYFHQRGPRKLLQHYRPFFIRLTRCSKESQSAARLHQQCAVPQRGTRSGSVASSFRPAAWVRFGGTEGLHAGLARHARFNLGTIGAGFSQSGRKTAPVSMR